MVDTVVEALILDLLEWLVKRDKTYGEVMYGNGRKSLAEALQQSESQSGFDWNIALDLGDMSGDVGLPKDLEGAEIVCQFGTLKNHHRETDIRLVRQS